jgi:general stress protein YciG
VSNDKQHMKEIGRMGGRAKRRKRGETVATATAE